MQNPAFSSAKTSLDTYLQRLNYSTGAKTPSSDSASDQPQNERVVIQIVSHAFVGHYSKMATHATGLVPDAVVPIASEVVVTAQAMISAVRKQSDRG